MRVLFFDSHRYDREAFVLANKDYGHEIVYLDVRLSEITAEAARGFETVCVFVNDCLNSQVLIKLKDCGVRFVALRSAGFNNLDLVAAKKLGLSVVRVPEYSPYAVAEHAVALLLTLNRKTHRASARVHDLNFSLEGLVGFDLHGKTIGVIGTGRIGSVFCRIMQGFGCRVLANDPHPNPKLKDVPHLIYTTLETLIQESDIISLHAPLVPETHHILNKETIEQMKDGAIIINTSRGALIDSKALVDGLKSGKIGGAALDVYEEEENVFFSDLSDQILQDDTLARLLTFPNVIITSHQAFLTREALANIAHTTLKSISDFSNGRDLGDRGL